MSRISIDIAHDLLQALREQPQGVVQEIRVGAALHYCHTRRLSLGQAARLARLDRGEAEVIALAEELRAHSVLLDERASRAMAITRGLPVIGTAGLLVRAKDHGFIPAVRPFLSRMQAAGWYSQRFIETLLERRGT